MSVASLSNISTQFSLYVGLPICICGIIGNLINIQLLFPSRSNSTSFLLIVSSFFNIIVLSEGLLPRVLTLGFNIDGSSLSIIYCKCRFLIAYTVSIASLTCLCFASLDRLFVSSRSVKWRNRSQLRTAKISITLASLVILASNIPFVVFYTIIEMKTSTADFSNVCVLSNPSLIAYNGYILRPVLLSILPGLVLSITGWLTYRNIKSIAGTQLRGSLQRNLTSMILLQIVTVIVPIIPFATINVYQIITSSLIKSSYRLAQEAAAFNITNIILYISYASNFYVYILSSTSYRRDFLQFLFFCYNRNRWANPIETMTREQFQMNTISMNKRLVRSVHPLDQKTVT